MGNLFSSVRAVTLLLFVVWGNVAVRAQDDTPVFVAPAKPVTAGSPAVLWLYCVNSSSNAVTRTFEAGVTATITSGRGSKTPFLLTNARPHDLTVTIGPGGFVREAYDWGVPHDLNGTVTVEVSNYNSVVVRVATESGSTLAGETAPALHTPAPQAGYMGFLTNHLSAYEPIYFILGTYPAAEFQFSIKYKVFRIENDLNPLGHLYFAYTQTSFWDLLSADPSFYDTSYKPSAFLYYQDVIHRGIFHLDLQPGFEHESNGKGGTDERSLYSAYLQPTATFELPENFQFVLQPRAWLYADVGDNNQDIADYRGYAWLSTALNWSDPKPFSWSDPDALEKVQLALKFDTGDTGAHDAWKLDLRFNLAFIPVLSRFNPTIQVQYFTGYGQTLRQYNEYSHGLRAGICLWY
jgi:outer membrane phospholipase A